METATTLGDLAGTGSGEAAAQFVATLQGMPAPGVDEKALDALMAAEPLVHGGSVVAVVAALIVTTAVVGYALRAQWSTP